MKKSTLWPTPVVLAFLFSAPVMADFSGIWEHESALETDGDLQKFESIIEPRWSQRLWRGSELNFVGRLRLDADGDLGPSRRRPDNYGEITGPWAGDEHAAFSLREFYLDTEFWGGYWRLGKQQIVWGQADGFKVLDVVNPQSFREFILDDFEDSRIPLWTVNAEYDLADDISLQLLWIPDTTYHELPEAGATYEFTSPALVPTSRTREVLPITAVDKPDRWLGDSEAGFKLGAFLGGWDLTLNYLYHYQDLPVLSRIDSPEASTTSLSYDRNHLLGTTASNAFGDWTLRFELAYNTDTFHIAPSEQRGVARSAEFASVIGIDFQGLDETLISVQWFQSHLFDYSNSILRPRTRHITTTLLRRYYRNRVWRTDLQWFHSPGTGDGMIRPKVVHQLSSDLEVWVGADLFYGTANGLFGEFDSNDRLTAGWQWSF